jgi:NAD(P)-dependent dehydrogenase (short-subunit alcohol dehydrogenase family)
MARKWTIQEIPSQKGRLAVVTGGNRGLGLEIVLALAGAGAHVVIATRDIAKAATAATQVRRQVPDANVEAMMLDQSDLGAIRRFSQALHGRFNRLDLLVNNASAILVTQGKTNDGFERHIGVNHLGSFALTGLLLDLLNAGTDARVVNTSSTAHRLVKGIDLDDLQIEHTDYKPMEAYGRSKLAALLYTFELDRRLRKAGSEVKAVAAHLPQLYAATATDVAGGDYYGPAGPMEMRGYPAKVGTKPTATDEKVAARLWTISEALTGVSYLD